MTAPICIACTKKSATIFVKCDNIELACDLCAKKSKINCNQCRNISIGYDGLWARVPIEYKETEFMLVRVTRINRDTLVVEDSTYSLIKEGFAYANRYALFEDIDKFKYEEKPLNFKKYMLLIQVVSTESSAFKDQLLIAL